MTSPRPTLDKEAIRLHFHAALRRRTPTAMWTAITDIPLLLADIDRLTSLLSWTRTEFANLLAAAQATLAAHRDDEPDPLSYLRDGVATHRPMNERHDR